MPIPANSRFSIRLAPMVPNLLTANKVAFSVRARNSKNDIRTLRRFAPAGKRDFEKGTVTGAPVGKHFRAADVQAGHRGRRFAQQPFKPHAGKAFCAVTFQAVRLWEALSCNSLTGGTL